MLLTKSHFLDGLHCIKYIWTYFNDRSKIPPRSSAVLYLLEQGNRVCKLAQKAYPNGIAVPTDDFQDNIKQTLELLKKRVMLFEGGIGNETIYARADILIPVEDDKWDIVEVKSSTKVKDDHFYDVAFQKYCYKQLGLNIRKCFIRYVNNEYVKQGQIDPASFFLDEDVTSHADSLISNIEITVDKMLKIINGKDCPEVRIGAFCTNKYEKDCPLLPSCWAHLPENHVYELYYGGSKKDALVEKGILAIKDIPNDFKLSDRQKIQRNCVVTKAHYVNKQNIKSFISKLQYPIYFLDFETINPCIPLYDGTRPYQQIPFQYSLHVIDKSGEAARHYSFLADENKDPREEFISSLIDRLGDRGTILVYNQPFEAGVLKDLKKSFPDHSDWVDKTLSRMEDLMKPFSSFDYHHPKQRGSWSLKKVLPVMSNKSYGDLDISEGSEASIAFLNIIFGGLADDQKKKIRKDLEKYCFLDTDGMVDVLNQLSKLI